jgi:hypothetical protein
MSYLINHKIYETFVEKPHFTVGKSQQFFSINGIAKELFSISLF